jgi:hypothetical protein
MGPIAVQAEPLQRETLNWKSLHSKVVKAPLEQSAQATTGLPSTSTVTDTKLLVKAQQYSCFIQVWTILTKCIICPVLNCCDRCA